MISRPGAPAVGAVAQESLGLCAAILLIFHHFIISTQCTRLLHVANILHVAYKSNRLCSEEKEALLHGCSGENGETAAGGSRTVRLSQRPHDKRAVRPFHHTPLALT